jgi:hypothetical protein
MMHLAQETTNCRHSLATTKSCNMRDLKKHNQPTFDHDFLYTSSILYLLFRLIQFTYRFVYKLVSFR